MDITELQQVQPHILLRFAKPRRDLHNLSVISGLCIGPNLITASALDSMLSSPKVKVKGGSWMETKGRGICSTAGCDKA